MSNKFFVFGVVIIVVAGVFSTVKKGAPLTVGQEIRELKEEIADFRDKKDGVAALESKTRLLWLLERKEKLAKAVARLEKEHPEIPKATLPQYKKLQKLEREIEVLKRIEKKRRNTQKIVLTPAQITCFKELVTELPAAYAHFLTQEIAEGAKTTQPRPVEHALLTCALNAQEEIVCTSQMSEKNKQLLLTVLKSVEQKIQDLFVGIEAVAPSVVTEPRAADTANEALKKWVASLLQRTEDDGDRYDKKHDAFTLRAVWNKDIAELNVLHKKVAPKERSTLIGGDYEETKKLKKRTQELIECVQEMTKRAVEIVSENETKEVTMKKESEEK